MASFDQNEKVDVAAMETRSLGAQEPEMLYTAEDEAKIRRKIDTRLIPALALLYLMSYLDRGNSSYH
jgi:hypothetical protein